MKYSRRPLNQTQPQNQSLCSRFWFWVGSLHAMPSRPRVGHSSHLGGAASRWRSCRATLVYGQYVRRAADSDGRRVVRRDRDPPRRCMAVGANNTVSHGPRLLAVLAGSTGAGAGTIQVMGRAEMQQWRHRPPCRHFHKAASATVTRTAEHVDRTSPTLRFRASHPQPTVGQGVPRPRSE